MRTRLAIYLSTALLALTTASFAATPDTAGLPPGTKKLLQEKIMLEFASKAETGDSFDKENVYDNKFRIEYAIESAQAGNKIALHWLNSTLGNGLTLLDPVWGGMYPYSSTKDGLHLNREKPLITQAINARLYVNAYLLTGKNEYWLAAEKTIEYMMNFLMSPDGAFYAGQAAKIEGGKQDDGYYNLSDILRRAKGVPEIDKNIYATGNGLAINALATMFMASGDVIYKETAAKTAGWIRTHLGVSGGGYKHGLNQSDGLYLSDSLEMGRGLLALYKITYDEKYLQEAMEALNFIDTHFQAADKSGAYVAYTSEADKENSQQKIDVAQNVVLLRYSELLYHYTGDERFNDIGKRIMTYLSNPEIIKNTDPALLLIADNSVENHPLTINIIGSKSDTAALELYMEALHFPSFYMQVGWYDNADIAKNKTRIEYPALQRSAAFFCYQGSCSLPMYTSQELDVISEQLKVSTQSAAPENITSSMTALLPKYSAIKLQKIISDILLDRNWVFIAFLFWVTGLLLAFTPCVFPFLMVLMTLLISEAAYVSRMKMFLLALTYVMSLSLTYAALGYTASLFGIYLQQFLQSPVVIVLMSIFLGFLSFSLLGAYKIKLPAFIQHYLIKFNSFHCASTYMGAACMGVILTLVASPCSAAPLIGVLAIISQIGDPVLGVFGLLMMGIGIGSPLLIAGVAGKKISLEISTWQHTLETFFGLFVMGMAIWLSSRAISGQMYMLFVSGFAILTALYMGVLKPINESLHGKIWKTISVMVAVYGIAIMIGLLSGSVDPFSPLDFDDDNVTAPRLSDMGFFENVTSGADLTRKLKLAKLQKRPVILDFYAKWCQSCNDIDRYVFTDQAIASMMRGFILLRVDLTTENDEKAEIAKRFGVVAPPAIVFFDKDGHELNIRLFGDITIETMSQTLEQVLENEV